LWFIASHALVKSNYNPITWFIHGCGTTADFCLSSRFPPVRYLMPKGWREPMLTVRRNDKRPVFPHSGELTCTGKTDLWSLSCQINGLTKGERVEWNNEDDLDSSGLPLPENVIDVQSFCFFNGRLFFATNKYVSVCVCGGGGGVEQRDFCSIELYHKLTG
jgi:hypothetical protein